MGNFIEQGTWYMSQEQVTGGLTTQAPTFTRTSTDLSGTFN
jgi:hypothetical protein